MYNITSPVSPLGIAEFIRLVNASLKQHQSKIIGEISELSTPPSGHVYFTLKDKTSDAILKCVIWKTNYQMQGVKLQIGLEVILSGKLEIYAPYGRIQYNASSIELVGEGQLKAAYEALKKQLSTEGIFSEDRKRPLPNFPQKIGIITSQTGAVIHDFSNNVGKHNYTFLICDSRIEGKQSLPDLIAAVKTMKTQEIDVLIIMRGGGSLQSLAAFDTEAMVRAIIDFPVPVIAAIGHHQDKPLTALAADVHVSTPTAAAMLLNKSWDDASLTLNKYSTDIIHNYNARLYATLSKLQDNKYHIQTQLIRIIEVFSNAQKKVESMILKSLLNISHHRLQLQQQTDLIAINFSRQISSVNHMLQATLITNSVTSAIESTEKQLAHCEEIITLRDPRRMLQYGYSIIRSGDTLIKSVHEIRKGEELNLLLSDGEISSKVESIKTNE